MKVHVKHAAKVYDISVEPQDTGLHLKELLATLTGVPADRQKVMAKGRQLANDQDLSVLKENQTLMMLGTAAPRAAREPKSVAEIVEQEEEYKQPLGLVNIGNTCYANSTLEALRTVPELNAALAQYSGSDQLLNAWAQLVPKFGHDASLDTEADAPLQFVMRLHQRFPQFAERGEDGMPKQQDAEEFWTQLMSELKGEIPSTAALFDGEFEVTTEKPSGTVHSSEPFSKLMVNISIQTNFLKDGLRASLADEFEVGGAMAKSTKRISKLPKQLTVQFVRFFWRRDTQKNSKILRKVTFPLNLDLGDLCTPELQAKMAPAREAYRELESAIEENRRAARRAKFRRLDEPAAAEASSDKDAAADAAKDAEEAARRAAIEKEEQEEKREKQRLDDLKKQFADSIDAELGADASCSPHALYELQAVVTHQGMSADSGHYQCFVKNRTKPNSWWRFNDDRVSEVDDNRIAQLAGGGASDSALILLYRSADY